jgi:hypothetical protein
MKRKEAVYKGLQFAPVWFEDTSSTSPDYFQISEFPTRITSGKNLFKLRGNPTNLRPGSFLNIEVLDYNGTPVYSEVIDFIDDDKSRVVAIYVYDETSPGNCTITLIGEAANVPEEWKGKPNVKWSRSVPVNPNVSNISEIIFETTPTLVVQEQVGVQLDRVYDAGGQFPTYSTGTVRYFTYNGQPAIELIGGILTNDMSTGTLTVTSPVNPTPSPTYAPSTTTYTSTIKKILSSTVALLDTEYMVYSSQSISSHTYSNFDASTYSILYEATPTYVPTQNSESFALMQIKGLNPATGDVSRVKVFMNNNGTVGTWELLNDVELEETEIFVSNTASLYPDESIGSFTSQSIIDTYWEGVSYVNGTSAAAPTLTWTTASLNNAMLIQNNVDISARNSVSIAKIKSSYNGIFIANSEYKITIDAIGTLSGSSDAKLSVYMSGSAFDYDATDYFNQQFPVKFGKRIGELTISQNNQRYDDVVFNFETDREGVGTLLLVVESGTWQIADVRTTTDNDSGYSPNYTRLRTLVPTAHKSNNELTFKAEYYNVNGEKSRQISYVYNKPWEGGNRYVDGDYSMLTGSLYVADTLESGVAISGYKNTGFVRSLGYEGFTAGFPGFLLWSGSALAGSAGTKGGVPYSGVGLELYANTSSYFRYSTADNEIEVRTDKFFFGNNSTFISGANGNIEISASNFHLSQQGNVTASNALFTGVALANIIRDKTVTITAANSSSYIDLVAMNSILPVSGSRIILDGSLGGEIVRRIQISCSLAFPIGRFVLPQIDDTAKVDVIVEFSRANNIYDVFAYGKPTFGLIPPQQIAMAEGSIVSLTPFGNSTNRMLVQYGTEMPSDYVFKQDVNISGSLTSRNITKFGSGTFTKAGAATGDLLLDNNSTDTPGILFYYANNSNYGIDSWNGSFDVLSGQLFRVTNNLNETGGAVKMAIDTTGNAVFTGFVKANAWRAGQVINDIMLSNTEVTVSTTTIATSTSDTDFLTYSYTPVSSNSYLIIHYHLANYDFSGGTGNDSYISRIKVDGTEITYSTQSTVNGNRSPVLFPLTGRYTNSSTAAKSIVVACRRNSADDSITITNSSTSMWLRITEIGR